MSGARSLLVWLAVLFALPLVGCAHGSVTLNVTAPPGTNHGRPLYMVVRKVDPKQYSTEGYNDVAAKVVSPDSAVLHSEVIYPGTLQRIQVKVPQDAPVAVSFLFTAPDGSWQLLLNSPVTTSVDIELQEGRIRNGVAPDSNEGAPAEGEPAKAEAPKAEAPKLEVPKLALPGEKKK